MGQARIENMFLEELVMYIYEVHSWERQFDLYRVMDCNDSEEHGHVRGGRL